MAELSWARRWAPRNLALALASGALGCGADAASSGVPGELEAEVEIVAAEGGVSAPITPLLPSVHIDESGLYWHNRQGALLARRHGGGGPVVLRESTVDVGLVRTPYPLGMAMDSERLYVGEAWLPQGVTDYFPVPIFEPPGRLLSIPKQGGDPTVVLELPEHVVWPVVVEGGRLIVFLQGAEESGYYELDRPSGELERLPLRVPFYSSVRFGDAFYWSDAEYPPTLLRTRIDDAEPEAVAPLKNNSFWVGPGYVLSLIERITEPELGVSQSFLLHAGAADAARELPGMGETISLTAALDARHVYWLSYRGEGPGTLPPAEPLLRLVRADLQRSALTVLRTPELAIEPSAALLGQDAERLYVGQGERLVAIEKPK